MDPAEGAGDWPGRSLERRAPESRAPIAASRRLSEPDRPKARMSATSPRGRQGIASSATATFPARRSAMMPEPTTVASNSAVPSLATTCARRFGRHSRTARVQKLGGHRLELSEDGCAADRPSAARKERSRRRRSGLADRRHAGFEASRGRRNRPVRACRSSLPAPLVDDQPGLAKYQGAAMPWVANTQNRDEIADAERTFAQQMEHAERVGPRGPEIRSVTGLSCWVTAGSPYPLGLYSPERIYGRAGRRKRPRAAFRRSSTRAHPGRFSRVASDGIRSLGHDHVRCAAADELELEGGSCGGGERRISTVCPSVRRKEWHPGRRAAARARSRRCSHRCSARCRGVLSVPRCARDPAGAVPHAVAFLAQHRPMFEGTVLGNLGTGSPESSFGAWQSASQRDRCLSPPERCAPRAAERLVEPTADQCRALRLASARRGTAGRCPVPSTVPRTSRVLRAGTRPACGTAPAGSRAHRGHRAARPRHRARAAMRDTRERALALPTGLMDHSFPGPHQDGTPSRIVRPSHHHELPSFQLRAHRQPRQRTWSWPACGSPSLATREIRPGMARVDERRKAARGRLRRPGASAICVLRI